MNSMLVHENYSSSLAMHVSGLYSYPHEITSSIELINASICDLNMNDVCIVSREMNQSSTCTSNLLKINIGGLMEDLRKSEKN